MRKIYAFSLIELSVVLVVIGFVLLAVVSGEKLIKKAQLSSVINEVSELKTAITTFRLRYGKFPGDMDDAYDYWGVGAGCINSTANTAIYSATTTETGCNGDGNNLIEWDSGEFYRSWQHLALAKAIPGTYTGRKQSTTSPYCVRGINCYPSEFSPLGHFMLTTVDIYLREEMHLFFAQSKSDAGGTDNHPSKPIISSQDAYIIDKKIDNGRPATGDVETINGWDNNGTQVTGCTSIDGTDIADTATYMKSDERILCIMGFFLNSE